MHERRYESVLHRMGWVLFQNPSLLPGKPREGPLLGQTLLLHAAAYKTPQTPRAFAHSILLDTYLCPCVTSPLISGAAPLSYCWHALVPTWRAPERGTSNFRGHIGRMGLHEKVSQLENGHPASRPCAAKCMSARSICLCIHDKAMKLVRCTPPKGPAHLHDVVRPRI